MYRPKINISSLLTLGMILILAACSKGSGDSVKNTQDFLSSDFCSVNLISSYPPHRSEGFPPDGEISIIMDQKLDSYSFLQDNFELFDQDGDRVGGRLDISGRYVDNPNGPGQVTELRIRRHGQYLEPKTRYTLMWGEVPGDKLDDPDLAALGIQSVNGCIFGNNGLVFTTGTEYSDFINSSELKVLSLSPGRILARGKDIDFNADFGALLNPADSKSYITLSRFAPIRIRFSQPIIDDLSALDIEENGFSELPPTDIAEFTNMMVGVFDVDTRFDQLFASVLNIDPTDPASVAAWNDWRNSYEGRLNGRVFTTDGRKTLNFVLADGEEYPDTLAQVVIVVVWNVKGYQSFHRLTDNFVVGGFLHYSGFRVDSPITFPWDIVESETQQP